MASAALVDKAGMEDLQRVSSSRGCRAVSEKEAGLFLRKRYQRAGGGGGGKRSGRSSREAGFWIGAARCETGFRTRKKGRGSQTRDPKKMTRTKGIPRREKRCMRGVYIRRPKEGFRGRTSWRGTSGDKQEEN